MLFCFFWWSGGEGRRRWGCDKSNVTYCILLQYGLILSVPPLRTADAVKQLGSNAVAAEKEAMRITGMTWAGIQRGSTFCGHLPVALGSFMYQVEGNRLVACIDVLECLGLMEGVPDDVTVDMGPDLIKA